MESKPLKRLGGLLIVVATTLAPFGCNSNKQNGDSGTNGTVGTNGTNGTNGVNGVNGTNGTNGVNGTNGLNGLPAAINIASLTANDWAALSLTGTINSVTMTGTNGGIPQVSFTVTDKYGNPIAGLASVTSKSSTALMASYPNFAFSIAKLVTGKGGVTSWVSYMIQSVPTNSTPPTASAPQHASSDATGTMTEDGNGNYTYTFTNNSNLSRDLTQMATWLAGQTVTSPASILDLGDVSYQPTLTHRVGVEIYGPFPGTGSNTPTGAATTVPAVLPLKAANLFYDFIPATGQVVYNPTAATPVIPTSTSTATERLITSTAACNSCHTVLAFHTSGRTDPNFCGLCHNDQMKYGQTDANPGLATTVMTGGTVKLNTASVGDMHQFIHKIHMGSNLGLSGYNFGGVLFNNIWYPQDIRNCTTCHTASAATPQGDNWKNVPSIAACGSCHDTISFAAGAVATTATNFQAATPVITLHSGGAQADDTNCASCHAASDITSYHMPVTTAVENGTNSSANHASYVSNGAQATSASNAPAGAYTIAYNIKSVTVNTSGNPVLTFQILVNGTAATLNTYASATPNMEMLANLANGPYVSIALGLPQDGTQSPMDPNFSREYWWPLKSLWNGTAYTTGLFAAKPTATGDPGQLISTKGPVGTNGTYTLTLDGIKVPTTVQLFGMGLGWGNFTQTNLAPPVDSTGTPALGLQGHSVSPNAWAWTPATSPLPAGTGTGGLMLPYTTAFAWANGTPTGYTFTPRRSIIEPGSCNSCHGDLGAFTPDPNGVNGYANNFHGAAFNDPTSCVICHNTNGVTAGWSYNAKTWIHALHAGSYNNEGTITPFRANAYTAHDSSAFWNIVYPGKLNDCEACHVPGSYDFSNATNAGQIPNMLWDSVATGTFPTATTASYDYQLAKVAAPGSTVSAPPINAKASTTLLGGTGATGIPNTFALTATTTGTVTYASPWVNMSTNYGSTWTANGIPASPTQNWATATVGVYSKTGAFSNTTAVYAAATPTSAVSSPLTAACGSCHDKATDIQHYTNVGGGVWYAQRSAVPLVPVGGAAGVSQATATAPVLAANEQCLVCHGPGTVLNIKDVHMNFR